MIFKSLSSFPSSPLKGRQILHHIRQGHRLVILVNIHQPIPVIPHPQLLHIGKLAQPVADALTFMLTWVVITMVVKELRRMVQKDADE